MISLKTKDALKPGHAVTITGSDECGFGNPYDKLLGGVITCNKYEGEELATAEIQISGLFDFTAGIAGIEMELKPGQSVCIDGKGGVTVFGEGNNTITKIEGKKVSVLL